MKQEPFFARSLTLVPRSLLLNRTETLATQAIHVPVIRGLTRFLTMAEVTRLKTVWSSLTVWQFFLKRAKEANIIATRTSLDVGFRELKNPL